MKMNSIFAIALLLAVTPVSSMKPINPFDINENIEETSLVDQEAAPDISHLSPSEKAEYFKNNPRKEHEPPRIQSEIKYEEFEQMHDSMNYTEKFPIFGLTRKYYFNREKNLTSYAFVEACLEYIVQDISSSDESTSFGTLQRLITNIRKSLRQQFLRREKVSFRTFFYQTIGGGLSHLIHGGRTWKELPQEYREVLETTNPEHTLRERYRKGEDEHRREPQHAEIKHLKHFEIERKVREAYHGVEWEKDGRRVIDEDYDEELPKYERKLHIMKSKVKDELSDDEIDMLLENDL